MTKVIRPKVSRGEVGSKSIVYETILLGSLVMASARSNTRGSGGRDEKVGVSERGERMRRVRVEKREEECEKLFGF